MIVRLKCLFVFLLLLLPYSSSFAALDSSIFWEQTVVPYQAKGPVHVNVFFKPPFHMGYEDAQSLGGLIKVTFTATLATENMRRYVLFRSAEIGRERKKKHFSIYGSLADASVLRYANDAVLEFFTPAPQAYAYVLYHNEKWVGDYSTSHVYGIFKKEVLDKRLAR